MSGFTLLWSKILESSLWVLESKETRLVWVTLLAMRDSEGIIQASAVGLADRAKVSLDECKTALGILTSPDPNDSSKVEEGRRLREVPGGWQIVNHELYRFSTEAKREFWRQQKAAQREQEKVEKEAFEKGKKAEFAKRVKKAAHNGAKTGAWQAVKQGIKNSNSSGADLQQQ